MKIESKDVLGISIYTHKYPYMCYENGPRILLTKFTSCCTLVHP